MGNKQTAKARENDPATNKVINGLTQMLEELSNLSMRMQYIDGALVKAARQNGDGTLSAPEELRYQIRLVKMRLETQVSRSSDVLEALDGICEKRTS